jgi:hypothetical protein
MKKLIIVSWLLSMTVMYPPNNSEAKPTVRTVKSSIINYEKSKHDAIVSQFFIKVDEMNKNLKHLRK